MNFEILQENLSRAISLTSRAISSLPQIPILGNLFIKTQKNNILFVGTNLETTISLSVPAKVQKEGEITVLAKPFAEFIGNLSGGKIAAELKGGTLELRHEGGRAKIPVAGAEEFPVKEILGAGKKEKSKFVVGAADFLVALKRVVFAAAVDETRPVLSGVLFRTEKEKLWLVATDGYRLSLDRVGLKSGGLPHEVIVSAKALREIERAFSQEGEIEIVFDQEVRQIFFSQEELFIGSRLIEGEFPDFTKILPQEGKTKIAFDQEEMSQGLRSLATFARESANIIRMETKKGALALTASASQVGEGEMVLKKAHVEGEELKVAFNFRFLLEAMSVFGGGEATGSFSGGLAPARLSLPKEKEFLHVIMPVRLQD